MERMMKSDVESDNKNVSLKCAGEKRIITTVLDKYRYFSGENTRAMVSYFNSVQL